MHWKLHWIENIQYFAIRPKRLKRNLIWFDSYNVKMPEDGTEKVGTVVSKHN